MPTEAQIETIVIRIRPADHRNETVIKEILSRHYKRPISDYRVIRESIDARKRPPHFQLRMMVCFDGRLPDDTMRFETTQLHLSTPRIIIVGAGPAGYFAALQCIENGLCPIVIDRGKDVQARRRDLRQIQQFANVNPDSNYCFGEGGAGTYSDGKLYTRSTKRGDVKKILDTLIEHGAPSEIAYEAHPHIGSNKLPPLIQSIRERIIACGGEVHFNTCMTAFIRDESGTLLGVIDQHGKEWLGKAVILATGHSARDVFQLLYNDRVRIDAKPFALGVRIEHPQPLIDRIQYGDADRSEFLPAATYSLKCQSDGRGVYSFCMCPGGFVVPAMTAPGEMVVNGMSLSRRDSPFANSGVVTSIELSDSPEPNHPLGLMRFQQHVERSVFQPGSLKAPAQRMFDFLEQRESTDLPSSSYIPGLRSAPLHELLPASISERLRDGIYQFDRKMGGYISHEAVLIGVESRTSSPVRIPRDEEALHHPELTNLYPCGEGAGYAGGIVSAALDGVRVANAIARRFNTL